MIRCFTPIFCAVLFVSVGVLGGCSSGAALQTRPESVSLRAQSDVSLASGAIEIPAEFHRHKVIVETTVNGHGPYRMILDTGSAVCQISPRIAREAGVRRQGWARTLDAHGGRHREPMGLADEILVGSVSGRGVPLTIDELPALIASDGDIEGIIGYNLFTSHTLIIDYPERRLAVSAERVSPREPGVTSLRLKGGRVPYVQARCVVGDYRGSSLEMLLDTGSGALLGMAGIDVVLLTDFGDTLERGASLSASGSIKPVEYARMIYDLEFNGVVARRLMAIVERDLSMDHSSIGGDFLRRFRVSIDPIGGFVRFELPNDAREIAMPVWLGHGFTSRITGENRAEVVEVVAGSAAERGGLRPGDIITGFGGKPLSTDPLHWPLPMLADALPAREFQIQRDGAQVHLTIEFQELLATPEMYTRRLGQD